MLIKQEHSCCKRSGAKLQFAFVYVFEDILSAVMEIKIPLAIRAQPHQSWSWIQFFEGRDVHASTSASELMNVIRVK